MGTPATIPPPPPGYGPVSVVPPPPPGYGPVSVVPGGASAPAAAAAPSAPAGPFANTASEGTYQMHGPTGPTDIPYSKVQEAGTKGYKFSPNTPDAMRYSRDRLADPAAPAAPQPIAKGDAVGFAKSAVQVPNTLAGWLDAIVGSHAQAALMGAEEKGAPGITAPIADNGEHRGAILETLGEWMAGEGMLKSGMTLAAHSQEVAKFASQLEKYPVLAKAVSGLMKSDAARFVGKHVANAAGAAAQTGLHGGTVDQAEEAGALTAAMGAGIDGAGMGAKAMIKKLAQPSITTAAIEEAAKGTVTSRLGETNATRSPQPNQLPPSTGEYTFTIPGLPTQEQVEGNIATDARKKQIGTQYVQGKGSGSAPKVDEYNHGAFMYDGDQAPLEPVNDQVPFSGKGHKEPVFQYLTDSKPGTRNPGVDYATGGATLTTKDINVVTNPAKGTGHLEKLNEVISGKEFAEMSPELQQAYREQRSDIQQQLSDYYKHQKATSKFAPNFEPRSVEQALSQTGDFHDAARQLEAAGKEVYEHANTISGGQWQSLKDAMAKASEDLHALPDIPANARPRKVLATKMSQMQSKMEDILGDPRNGVDQTDADQARKNFHAQFVLDEAHKAIQNIYDIEQHQPLKTGQYKGFNGNRLGHRWKAFLAERPEARQIIGGDRVDTLQRLFDANDTMAARKRFGNAIMSVASALAGYHFGGLEGTIVGEGAYHGTRMALNGVLANSKAAKSLLFAIESGARPENYAPGIAKMIMRTTRVGRAAIPVAAEQMAHDGTDHTGATAP